MVAIRKYLDAYIIYIIIKNIVLLLPIYFTSLESYRIIEDFFLKSKS